MDAHVLIAADHGNAEQMKDYATGMVKTSHTLNDVECFYVAPDSVGVKLAPAGKLCDVAPTVLGLLGLLNSAMSLILVKNSVKILT